MSAGADRIRWTDEEKGKLFDAAAPKVLAGVIPYQAIISVQDIVLGEDRRRSIVNIGAVPRDLRMKLEALKPSGEATLIPIEEYNRVKSQVEEKETAISKQATDISRLAEENRSLKAELARWKALPQPPTEAEVVKAFFSDIMGRALAQARFEGAAPAKAGTLHAKHHPEPRSDGKPKLKQVVIIGPIREQRITLLEEFDGLLDLRIFSADEVRGRQADLTKYADKVIIWTKFVSHETEHSIAKEKLIRQDSFQAIRDRLTELAVS